MGLTVTPPLSVFYDGACGMCDGVMRRYHRYASDGLLQFIDIADPGFRAEDYHRTQAQFTKELHVLDADGRLFTGVDAVAAIWRVLPPRRLRRLAASFLTFPGIHFASRGVYALIARNRGRSRRKDRCAIHFPEE